MHADARLYHKLGEEATMLDHVAEMLAEYRSQRQAGGPLAPQTWTLPAGGQSVSLFSAARKNSGGTVTDGGGGAAAAAGGGAGVAGGGVNPTAGGGGLLGSVGIAGAGGSGGGPASATWEKHRSIRADDDSQFPFFFLIDLD